MKRSNSFHSGHRKTTVPTNQKMDVYRSIIPFQHIHIDGVPLKKYLKEQGARSEDVTILPCILGKENVIFYIRVNNISLPISATDIQHFETFSYWLGVSGEKEHINIIRECGKWSTLILHKKKYFIQCQISRPSPYHFKNNTVQYFPLGWHNVLPKEVLEKANEEGWRIHIAPIEECWNLPCDKEDVYNSNGFMHCLTEIPVQCYSVQDKSAKLERTIKVDIRNFHNMHGYFQYQKLKFGESYACITPLDLFDAMLANKARWHVEPSKELIYLPCVRRPPERFYRIIEMKKDSCDFKTVTHSENFLTSVRDMFPFSEDVKSMSDQFREEVVMRMKSAGPWPSFLGPEKGVVGEQNRVFYIVPSIMSYTM